MAPSTGIPTTAPTGAPSVAPTNAPTNAPTAAPTLAPTCAAPGFVDSFAPLHWEISKTLGPNDADVLLFNADALQFVSSNANGTNASIRARFVFSESTHISFDWNYTTVERSQYDEPRYAINHVEHLFPGYDVMDNPYPQSGSFSVSLNQGDIFDLIAWTSDGTYGPAVITYFNWKVTCLSATPTIAPTPCLQVTSGFVGSSDPTAWNVSTNAGSDAHVISFTAQNLTMVGNAAAGPNYTLWVSRVFTEDVAIGFTWKFTTKDRPAYDQPRYAVNGVQQLLPGFDASGAAPSSQSGTFGPLMIAGGSVFSLIAWSKDGLIAPGYTEITMFTVSVDHCTQAPTPCNPTYAGFVGPYAVANWNHVWDGSPNNATLSIFDSSTLQMITNNAGTDSETRLIVSFVFPVATVFSFNWNYSTVERPEYDQPRLILDGVETLFPGYDPAENAPLAQSGTALNLHAGAGSVLSFVAWSSDGNFGAATITVDSWVATAQLCTSSPTTSAPTPCIVGTSGFNGPFAFNTWAIANGTGSLFSTAHVVNFNANQLQMVTNNFKAANQSLFVSHTVSFPTSIAFTWSYETLDRPEFDQPHYGINGVDLGPIPGFDPHGDVTQNGTFVLPYELQPSDTFSFIAWSLDGVFLPATITITGWTAGTNKCTNSPTTASPTQPTHIPTTRAPVSPTTRAPSRVPTTSSPTFSPTLSPTTRPPSSLAPSRSPTTRAPSGLPTSRAPTSGTSPTTRPPSPTAGVPTTRPPTSPSIPSSPMPTTRPPSGGSLAPTTIRPTTRAPTPSVLTTAPTPIPATLQPSKFPTTKVPTTVAPVTHTPTAFGPTNAPHTRTPTTRVPSAPPSSSLAPTTSTPTSSPTVLLIPPYFTATCPATAVVGAPYHCTVSANGKPDAVISITTSGPNSGWLQIQGNVLSGVPQSSNGGTTITITATATNGAGNAMQMFSVTVVQPPVFTSVPVTFATVGALYMYPITAIGSPNPSVMCETLPAWLRFDPTQGLVGVPTTPGVYTISCTASNGVPSNDHQQFTVIVGTGTSPAPTLPVTNSLAPTSAPTLAPSTQPTAAMPPHLTANCPGVAPLNTQYLCVLSVTGDQPLSLSLDAAPSWLQLVGSVLMGTPIGVEGTFAVVVTATNGVVPSASSTFLITVPSPTNIPPTAAPTTVQSTGTVPVITSTPSSSSILINTVYISAPIQATGSGVTYQSPDLPSWLYLDPSSGVLTGIPRAEGTYTFQVTATNSAGVSTPQIITLSVGSSPLVSSAPGVIKEGVPWSYKVETTGSGPMSVALIGLPSWLSFDPATNTVSGVPPRCGDVNSFTVVVTNFYGSTTQPVNLVTSCSPRITSEPTLLATPNNLYTYPIVAVGTGSIALQVSGLPSWLVFNPTTGVLSGYPPSEGGSWDIAITASNGIDPSARQDFTLTALSAPATTSTANTQGAQGHLFVFPLDVSGNPAPSLVISNNPSWLSLNGNVVSGTPPVGTTSATFTITATNVVGSTSTDYSLVFGTSESCQAGINRLSFELATTSPGGGQECSDTSAFNRTDGQQTCLNGCSDPVAVVVNLTLTVPAGRRLLGLSVSTQQTIASDLARQWNINPSAVTVLGDSTPLRVIVLLPNTNYTLAPVSSVASFNVTATSQNAASQKDLLDLIMLTSAQRQTSQGSVANQAASVEQMPYWVFIIGGLLFVSLVCCCFFFCSTWCHAKKK